MTQGAGSNLSLLSMGAHTGTHVDAPLHFIQDGRSIDQVALDVLCGPCRVVDCGDADWITGDLVRSLGLVDGDRVLFRTKNSDLWGDPEFQEDAVAFDPSGAMAISELMIRLVGIDYLSAGSYRQWGAEVHRILLGAGIPIIESLDLSRVEPGRYELVCAPLLIQGAEGAPARVMIRPLAER